VTTSKSRLVVSEAADENNAAGGLSTPIIPRNPRLVSVGDPLDELAAHIDGCFVVVVHVTGDKYRRRCFLTAKAAERAVRNAQAAGHNARVFLAELKPLWRLTGGSS
jgi:hypothetical protein